MSLFNFLGWYTKLWVNRRSRRAPYKSPKYYWHYRRSWERYIRNPNYDLVMAMLGGIKGEVGSVDLWIIPERNPDAYFDQGL